MLHILAHAQELSTQAKLLFDSFPWRDETSRIVCTEEIPCVKSREVLEGTQNLVTANCEKRRFISNGEDVVGSALGYVLVVATNRR